MKQYAAGETDKATDLLKQIQNVTKKLHLSMADNNKRLKNAEILLRHTAFRLTEFLHNSSTDDREVVQATLGPGQHAPKAKRCSPSSTNSLASVRCLIELPSHSVMRVGPLHPVWLNGTQRCPPSDAFPSSSPVAVLRFRFSEPFMRPRPEASPRSLTEAQVEKIREAGIDPNERIKLYTEYVNDHVNAVKALTNRGKSDARARRLDKRTTGLLPT